MKYAVLTLAVAGLTQAQSNTTTTSSLIPSNITSSCTTFLESLNSDGNLSSCVTPLINATASFSPTAQTNLTEDSINYTLASICKSNAGCSDSTIRGWLANFYSQCNEELTSPTGYNSDVRELYDILYVVNPLKGAVCSINSSNQEYCVNEIVASEKNATSSSSSNSTAAATGINNATLFSNLAATAQQLADPIGYAAKHLVIEVSVAASSLSKRFFDKRQDNEAQNVNMVTVIKPNTATYKSTNLPFLFLQPSMASSALCTPCTREVMVAYVRWETQVPYALGLKQSPILGGQSDLWNAINSTCGVPFINAIKSEVGALAQNFSSSAQSTLGLVGQNGISGVSVMVGATFVSGLVALFI
ncbi:hypothetical protein I302_101420 [Kwoniella bestiolae CBS 10118]|uniref:DUF7729 domain-containing protein n=1 Tax=Kwoniella bestiolae CBS 10118 TaxID=1296100 RepID=A0A1B9GC74_9TREE|nr:hypothetical protein I302_00102 [Kwoniella bestiolae CBS 10118]OCF28614.1 hypothetical protein I302_00102 [Kwoniella bestiolae CBS 10118]